MSNDILKKHSLEKYIKEIDMLTQKLRDTSMSDEERKKHKEQVLATISGIFEQMEPEQLLLYAANLYYRHKLTSSTNFDPDESEISPPKQEERLALSLGILERFRNPEYDGLPEIRDIRDELNKKADPFSNNSDFYQTIMSAAARLVHDKRGAQWLLQPGARIAIGHGEMAEFHPHIWMQIQDLLLKYLSPPQLADLYTLPVSRRNAGEILRRQKNPRNNYHRAILEEALIRKGRPPKDAGKVQDAEVRQIFKELIHEYKIACKKLKPNIEDEMEELEEDIN